MGVVETIKGWFRRRPRPETSHATKHEAAHLVSPAVAEPIGEPIAAPQTATREIDLAGFAGVGEARAQKLAARGLLTPRDLLTGSATAKKREEICSATGIGSSQLLRWVNIADLLRVGGIDESMANLLEAAGVDTVPELARRRADNLTAALASANNQKNLVKEVPSEAQVAGWIQAAKGLPRVIEY